LRSKCRAKVDAPILPSHFTKRKPLRRLDGRGTRRASHLLPPTPISRRSLRRSTVKRVALAHRSPRTLLIRRSARSVNSCSWQLPAAGRVRSAACMSIDLAAPRADAITHTRLRCLSTCQVKSNPGWHSRNRTMTMQHPAAAAAASSACRSPPAS
jgi:hypothetical protein